MQDAAPAVGGGGGRFFGGGDRRLRAHGHHNQQAVKCPRCDSPNTKFCYYNNYNMSQPRHFCRSCQRYWTKGGVLRNVPVGGGCRKSKRSSTQAKQAEVTGPTQPDSTIADKSSSTTSDQTTAQQEDKGGDNKATTPSVHKNDDGLLVVGTEDKPMEFQLVLGGGTTSGGMMTSSEEMMGFSSVVNQSTPYEDEFKAVDYDGDPGLFDLTAAVDPSYWTDQPSSLNFLP